MGKFDSTYPVHPAYPCKNPGLDPAVLSWLAVRQARRRPRKETHNILRFFILACPVDSN